MATVVLNLDSSDTAAIKFRRGQTIDILFEYYEADGATPLILDGTVLIGVSTTPDNGGVIKTLTEGDGLAVASNTVTIDMSVLEPLLVNPIHYSDVRNVKADGKIWYIGKIIFIMNKNITD